MPEPGLHGLELVEVELVAGLLIFSVVAVVARRWRFPYTVALVLVGLALSLLPRAATVRLPEAPASELILALFLPPLLFEAALHLRARDIRRDAGLIFALAIPGLALAAALTGGTVAALGLLPLTPALLFGALISATDPVAVVSTFRSLGAPRRLATLVEAESLFNDGAAIVLFTAMVGLAFGGHVDVPTNLFTLALVSVGGIGTGLALGLVSNRIIAHIDDHLVETTVTTVLCYGSFLLAEAMGVSGVLAVVTAGIVKAEGGPRGMSPTTRIVLFSFWDYAAFLANSFLFLLIGFTVNIHLLLDNLWPVLQVVVAVVVARAIVIYGFGLAFRGLKRGVPLSYLHLLVWGGLRGAVAIALALSLPFALAEREQVLALTFGVVLFTLLVQATTVPVLLRRLGFVDTDPSLPVYERLQGELAVTRTVLRHVEELSRGGGLPPDIATRVEGELGAKAAAAATAVKELLAREPAMEEKLLAVARLEALRSERAAVQDLEARGVIGRAAAGELQADVDARILAVQEGSAVEDPDSGGSEEEPAVSTGP